MAPKATPPSGPPTPQTKGKPAPRLSAHSASSQLLGLPRTEAYLPSHRETHERANYKPWGTQMPTWAGKDGTRGGPSKWNQWWQPAPPTGQHPGKPYRHVESHEAHTARQELGSCWPWVPHEPGHTVHAHAEEEQRGTEGRPVTERTNGRDRRRKAPSEDGVTSEV